MKLEDYVEVEQLEEYLRTIFFCETFRVQERYINTPINDPFKKLTIEIAKRDKNRFTIKLYPMVIDQPAYIEVELKEGVETFIQSFKKLFEKIRYCDGCLKYYEPVDCYIRIKNLCQHCSWKLVKKVPDDNCAICLEPLKNFPCDPLKCCTHFLHIKCKKRLPKIRTEYNKYQDLSDEETDNDNDDGDGGRWIDLPYHIKKCPQCREEFKIEGW